MEPNEPQEDTSTAEYSRVEIFVQDCTADGIDVAVTEFPESDE